MRKNIYISDDKKHVLSEVERLFKDEKSLSQLIIEALEKSIQDKKEMEKFETFILEDEGVPVKLIGKKLAFYSGIVFLDHEYVELPKKMQKQYKIGWNEMTDLNNKLDLDINFNKWFDLIAYQTRTGKIYIEVNRINNQIDVYDYRHLSEIKKIWSLYKNCKLYDINEGFSPWQSTFILPRKFLEDIKMIIGENYITRIIE